MHLAHDDLTDTNGPLVVLIGLKGEADGTVGEVHLAARITVRAPETGLRELIGIDANTLFGDDGGLVAHFETLDGKGRQVYSIADIDIYSAGGLVDASL